MTGKDFTEFEIYMMTKIDKIDDKVSRLNVQVTKGASFWGGVTGTITSMIGFILLVLSKGKI